MIKTYGISKPFLLLSNAADPGPGAEEKYLPRRSGPGESAAGLRRSCEQADQVSPGESQAFYSAQPDEEICHEPQSCRSGSSTLRTVAREYAVPAKHAGRKARCQKCGSVTPLG